MLHVSGPGQSLSAFASFLKAKLAANNVSPAVQVALAKTVIFWPSTAGLVPIVDTPGTSDANTLNADTTYQAVNDAMARTSSQLLLCGEKSFETENSLADFVIPYFKHMITSKSGLPAIKGILVPYGGLHYGPAELTSAVLQSQDRQREANSMSQLASWLDMANKDLPQQQRGSPAQLQGLLARCEIKVVYMQLYTSLCLQTSADLEEFALKGACTVNELLSLTHGPWLMSRLSASRDDHVQHVFRSQPEHVFHSLPLHPDCAVSCFHSATL